MKNLIIPFLLAIVCVLNGQENGTVNWESLVGEIRALKDQGRFQEATQKNEELKVLKVPEGKPTYAEYYFINQADILLAKGDYPNAEKMYLEVKERWGTTYDTMHHVYANVLNKLGDVYDETGQYQKATKNYLSSMAILKKLSRENTMDYARNLSSLAIIYRNLGKYGEAEPNYLKAITIIKDLVGDLDPQYGRVVTNLGVFYWMIGRYDEAELYLLEGEPILKQLGDHHPAYASSLDNLGNLYSDLAQFEKAESYLTKAREIRYLAYGEAHSIYANSLNNIAVLYDEMGRHEEAEPLYLACLKIRKDKLGETHQDYIRTQYNLAISYMMMGQFEKGEEMIDKAKEGLAGIFGREHRSYGMALLSLAQAWGLRGKKKEALPLLEEAKVIFENSIGKQHPFYAVCISTMAGGLKESGQYEQAEMYYKEAIQINEDRIGKESSNYAYEIGNLGLLYDKMGRLEKADTLLKETHAILIDVLGKSHRDVAQSFLFAGNLNWKLRRYEEALNSYLEANVIDQNLLSSSAKYLTERELQQYIRLVKSSRDVLFSLAHYRKGEAQNASAQLFNNTLFQKGFLLNISSQLRRLAQGDPEAKNQLELLRSYLRRAGAEYAKPLNKRADVSKLEEQARLLEKQLISDVPGFEEAIQQISWQQVQQALAPGEAVVEFVHYHYRDPVVTDSVFYAALVLRKEDSEPYFIPLFEEDQLAARLDPGFNTTAEHIAQLYHYRSEEEQPSLYELIWLPLSKLLATQSKLYVAPSGLLHRLNLGTILKEKEQAWQDKYETVLIGSARQLVLDKTISKDGPIYAHLYGGIDYNRDSIVLTAKSTNASTLKGGGKGVNFSLLERGDRGSNWQFLPGSEQEVEQIRQLIEAQQGHAVIFKGQEAKKQTLKQLDRELKTPRVLHIATHGYFLPDPDIDEQTLDQYQHTPAFRISEHPMIRSGLIFAGGNHAWQGKPAIEGVEDGILTAYEASQLNLRETELVVLSACNTGLGDISGSEGVYGLQRAFKIAGARYLLMSLWSVPDEQTQELMTNFYQYWLQDKLAIPQALKAAQQAMRKKYKEHYYWAGFVLLE